MDRIIDIATDGLHLAVDRGFLTVNSGQDQYGRVPLDDIAGLITHAHGLTWTNQCFVKLSERGIPIVICSANHAPVACVWPLQGHHLQGERLRLQIGASKPLQKQLWQKLVIAKILMQGAVISSIGINDEPFRLLARYVRSDDSENAEAQSARRYWPLLFGSEFRRDTNGEGKNALLNYGYTILRSLVARSICGAGLTPGLGLHHSNRANAFALADDVMEPFRPIVDRLVFNLVQKDIDDVSREAKHTLANLGGIDLESDDGSTSTLATAVANLVHSIITSFENGEAALQFPKTPKSQFWESLGTETS